MCSDCRVLSVRAGGFLVYRRGKTASAGGGVVGVPLGGRRTGNTGGAMESGRALPCYWMVGGGMKCE